jgi:hypothetical protein
MADYSFHSIVEPVVLTLDRPRRLRLEIGDVLAAERAMCARWGKPVNILTIFAETLTLNDLCILLWAALSAEDPTLTLEQTERLITIDRLGDIMTAVMDAWNRGMQRAQPAPGEGDGSPFPSGFPGSVSGATPVLS